MAVDVLHPDYAANATAWLRARDVFAGEDAVKAAGKRYLPRLDSQTDGEYDAYRARASFFNATARTADGFVGLILRREATVKLPDDRPESGDGREHLTPALSALSCFSPTTLTCPAAILSRSRERGISVEAERESARAGAAVERFAFFMLGFSWWWWGQEVGHGDVWRRCRPGECGRWALPLVGRCPDR